MPGEGRGFQGGGAFGAASLSFLHPLSATFALSKAGSQRRGAGGEACEGFFRNLPGLPAGLPFPSCVSRWARRNHVILKHRRSSLQLRAFPSLFPPVGRIPKVHGIRDVGHFRRWCRKPTGLPLYNGLVLIRGHGVWWII